jgi:hypothetical protein
MFCFLRTTIDVLPLHCINIDGSIWIGFYLKVLPEKGRGDKNLNRRSAGAMMVRTMFHRPPCAGAHYMLLVVGYPIRTYQRFVCYH